MGGERGDDVSKFNTLCSETSNTETLCYHNRLDNHELYAILITMIKMIGHKQGGGNEKRKN